MTKNPEMASVALGGIAVIAATTYVLMTPDKGMSMDYDFSAEIIEGQTKPLYTWEGLYWTPR
jgi:hypothetical protein